MTAAKRDVFNTDVAVLRATAILCVLGYHFFPGHVPWGFVGVDIFFVISGYLIMRILSVGQAGVLEFFLNRFRRIYPALLVMLLLTNAAGLIFLLDDEMQQLLRSSVLSLLQMQNYYEMSRAGYFVDAVNFRPLLHLWSLSVEFQLYLAMPVILIIGRKLGCSDLKSLLFIAALSLAVGIVGGELLRWDTFFLTPVRVWEFLAGALCYLAPNTSMQAARARWLCVFGAVMGLLVVVNVRPDATYPGIAGLAPVLGACAFILAAQLGRLPKFVLRPMLYVAGASYSLYLLHFPALEFVREFYGSPTIIQRAALLALTFVGAHLIDYILVPRFLKNRSSNKVMISASGLLLLSFTALLALLPVMERAIEQRNPVAVSSGAFKIDYREACSFLDGMAHEQDRCRLGAASAESAKLVLLGDSLSNSMTTVMDAMAQHNPAFGQYVQVGRGRCPLVVGAGDLDCDEFSAQALAFVDRLDPSVPVILAGQWPLYANASNPDMSKRFVDSLSQLLAKLSANGRKVIFAHSVPLGALPRTCLARMPGSMPGSCDIPVAIAKARQEGYREMVAPIIAKYGVTEYDPQRWLCDERSCAVFDAGKIFYLDDSHLSRQGGAELANRSYRWWLDTLTVVLRK